jgi:hypothetical protein
MADKSKAPTHIAFALFRERGFRRSLGGEAFAGERSLGHHFSGICRRRCCSFFLDLGEQPDLDRGSGPLSLRGIVPESARLDDDGAQLGYRAATIVVEVDKREARARHRVLEERDRRRRRQTMLAA